MIASNISSLAADAATYPGQAPGQKPHPSSTVVPLHVLLKDVVDAREAFAHQRQSNGPAMGSVDAARARLLAALSSYTTALQVRRLPVPYALRDELRIQLGVARKG